MLRTIRTSRASSRCRRTTGASTPPTTATGTPGAVQHARRELLAGEPFDAVSTLLTDDSHFEGSILVARGEDAARLADDPFGCVFPARVLHIGAGLLGRVPRPAGPVIERYGSAQP